jgi:hypothetical protein
MWSCLGSGYVITEGSPGPTPQAVAGGQVQQQLGAADDREGQRCRRVAGEAEHRSGAHQAHGDAVVEGVQRRHRHRARPALVDRPGEGDARDQCADRDGDDGRGQPEAEDERGGHGEQADHELESRVDREGDEAQRGHDAAHGPG